MQSEIHPHVIDQQNPSQQVRQNLINSSNPELQMQNIPVLNNLAPPQINIHFVQDVQTTQLLQYLQSRRMIIPFVPISKYKYFTQILMFFTCFIEMVFFSCSFIHAIWFLWYPVLGFHRHNINNRKIRFFGELIHMLLWIVTNCYIFSGHQVGLFPILFLIGNMDYYFIGFNLIFTYFCFTSYMVWNCCADFRLKVIARKLANRRKQIVENQLKKFAQNERNNKENKSIHNQQSLAQNHQQSVEGMQRQINEQKKEDANICPICLTSFNQHGGLTNQYFEILRLSCQHRFHQGCLKSWIQTNQSKCPVCRVQMFS